LCDATENKDIEAFSAVLRDYDRLSKLDGWKTNILLKVKNAIAKAEVDDGIL
jgi:alpha-soluble NSF attachment protein